MLPEREWLNPKRLPIRRLLFLSMLSLVTACGFQPLYGERSDGQAGVESQLAQVLILPISERAGQQLHNLLRDRFNPAGQPAASQYELKVEVRETIRKLGVRLDATATRANLTLRAVFILRARGDKRILFQGNSSSTNSYDIFDLEIQFSTVASEEDARHRGLRELSDSIKTRVALFLRKQPS